MKATLLALMILAMAVAAFGFSKAASADAYPQNMVSVASPAYCSTINGNTVIKIVAPGLTSATVKCWKQGPGFGSDSTVGVVSLDDQGRGSIVFPANRYPHGPITVTIAGTNGTVKDNCYLQLYNKGGIPWKEGIPKADPPAAKGMHLVFADDFKGPLSIGGDAHDTYYDHKPPNGSTDFSSLPFTNYDSPRNPFSQVGSWLRIRASVAQNSAGLLCSVRNDGSGIMAKAPCYFECRFLGPNAPGTWPAFWLMTDNLLPQYKDTGVDELDIIEAYGGEGPHEPNSYDKYQITPHCWGEGDAANQFAQQCYAMLHNPCTMSKFGIPSTWYETFHTYGCKVTEDETIYYCDNIEVGRHPTLPLSKKEPIYFFINLATGGGWPVDLSRYNGLADMYVDYVRVYQGQ